MESNKRVLLGISGGVDSCVSAILLKEEGYEVVGVTMKLFLKDNNETQLEDAKKNCDKIGIEHHVYDFTDEFNKYVINDFIQEYKKGKTPNPCIKCNKYLKFGKMYELAKKLNCSYISTGHYAKVEYSDKYNCYVLKKSNNLLKDQSYVLYPIDKEILPYILFPLNKFESKAQIRKIASDNNLEVSLKPDSQDICFIPDNNHVRFLDENIQINSGKIYDVKGNLKGTHTGFTHYTIGQRKGLGIQNEKPLYVVNIDSNKNQIIVGEKKFTHKKELSLENINVLVENVISKDGTRANVKIRYKAKEAPATVYLQDDNIKVIFDVAQFAITPGQSCVIYIDDIVIAGGVIK